MTPAALNPGQLVIRSPPCPPEGQEAGSAQPPLGHQACLTKLGGCATGPEYAHEVCVCAFLGPPDPLISAEYELSVGLDSGHQTPSLPFCPEGEPRVTWG